MTDKEDDLYWHALNYRTAASQHAEQMWRELLACVERRNATLRDALRSIALNTCCDGCQEAARVAQAALRAIDAAMAQR